MKRAFVISVAILFTSFSAMSQKMDSVLRMSIQGGVGWSHYYNGLAIQGNSVKSNFLGASARIMWEPGHRLSLGVESGYYKLYKVDLQPGDGDVTLYIIPVMANIRMRILKEFFITGGTGVVLMNSELKNANRAENNGTSTVLSYSNVQVSGLYLHHLTTQFAVGGEFKFMWLDKTNDVMHSLQAVVSYRF